MTSNLRRMDFRAAIARIDRLADELRAVAGVTLVEVTEYPLDVSSESRVSGSATTSAAGADAAFRLKFVLGIEHGDQKS